MGEFVVLDNLLIFISICHFSRSQLRNLALTKLFDSGDPAQVCVGVGQGFCTVYRRRVWLDAQSLEIEELRVQLSKS
jgi:hypothetical protein